MNRAQEIRKKRLEERLDEQKEIAKKEQEIKDKVEELYDWVLDMFEYPTDNNTKDEVHLSDTYQKNIQIGYNYEKGLTNKPFECEVIKQLADKFDAEDGFTGSYFSGRFPDSYASATIKIA